MSMIHCEADITTIYILKHNVIRTPALTVAALLLLSLSGVRHSNI